MGKGRRLSKTLIQQGVSHSIEGRDAEGTWGRGGGWG